LAGIWQQGQGEGEGVSLRVPDEPLSPRQQFLAAIAHLGLSEAEIAWLMEIMNPNL
jgi:hypothetical protein